MTSSGPSDMLARLNAAKRHVDIWREELVQMGMDELARAVELAQDEATRGTPNMARLASLAGEAERAARALAPEGWEFP